MYGRYDGNFRPTRLREPRHYASHGISRSYARSVAAADISLTHSSHASGRNKARDVLKALERGGIRRHAVCRRRGTRQRWAICEHSVRVEQTGENNSERQSKIEAVHNECLPTLIADLFPHYDRHGQGVVINIRIKVLEYLVRRRARTAPIRPTLPSNSLVETTPRASSGPGGGRETLRDEVNILPPIYPIETASEAVPSEVRT